MKTFSSAALVVLTLALSQCAHAQLLGVGSGTKGSVLNVGTGGSDSNLVQALGGCTGGLIQLCLLGSCTCVLPTGSSGTADPILTDFAGNKFEFMGDAGSVYALYADSAHQLNMKLFPGYVDGHNGTYMGNFGLAFHDYRISINLAANGDLTVDSWREGSSTDDLLHIVDRDARPTNRTLGQVAGNQLAIELDPFKANIGRTVDITTGTLRLSVWSVPNGTVDSLGVVQPAYLNFNLTLLAPPAGDVAEGIIGESLEKILQKHLANKEVTPAGESLTAEGKAELPTFEGKGLMNDYRVTSLFGTDFHFKRFGASPKATIVARRAMIASHFAALNFPMMSTSLVTK